MRAAKIKEHPGFLLMKQTDVQSIYYRRTGISLSSRRN